MQHLAGLDERGRRELIEACMRGEVTETETEITDKKGNSITVYVRPLPAERGRRRRRGAPRSDRAPPAHDHPS